MDPALDGPTTVDTVVSESSRSPSGPSSVNEPERETSSADQLAQSRSICAVKLPTFEGPLDLRLHLIRANDVDIHDIPIALISEQYLEYLELMQQIDVDVAADYLVMAATLAYIKSRMLLPPDSEADEEPGEDPRAELARRLAEYAIFKEVALDLDRRPLLGRDVFSGSPDLSTIGEKEPVLSVSLFAMLEALRRVLAELPEDQARVQVSLERISLRERMTELMDRLQGDPSAVIYFEDLLADGERTRRRIVVTFLAILELARIQAVRIFQNTTGAGQPFGPVLVRLAVAQDATAAEIP